MRPINLLLLQPNKSRPLYIFNDDTYSIQEFTDIVWTKVNWLLESSDCKNKTVIMLVNETIDSIALFWALTVVGSRIILLNSNMNSDNLSKCIQLGDVNIIISDREVKNVSIPVIHINDISSNNKTPSEVYDYNENDIIAAWTTSGTTSGNINLVGHTSQFFEHTPQRLEEQCTLHGVEKNDVLLVFPKLTFIFGFANNVIKPLSYGTTNVIGTSLFEINKLNALCKKYNANHLYLSPSVLNIFIKKTRAEDIAPTLKTVLSVGEPLPHSAARIFKEKFGLKLVNLYGLTETGPISCFDPDPVLRPRSIGKNLSQLEIKIIDDNDEIVPAGTVGRLAIKSKANGVCYLNNKKESDLIFKDDNWVHTNDLVYQDNNGYIIFVGRQSTCFKIRGDWISVSTIEGTLSESPAVAECVIMQQTNNAGDIELTAYVVPNKDIENPLVDINDHLNKNITNKKLIPKIVFIDMIPKTLNMKTIRNPGLYSAYVQLSKNFE